MSASIVGSKKGKGEGWKEDVVNGKDVDLPKTSTCLQHARKWRGQLGYLKQMDKKSESYVG